MISAVLLWVAAHGDLINGCFEAAGAYGAYKNVRAIWRDKTFAGINPWTYVIFTAWGFWNLIYYPALHQLFSAVAGGVLAGCNLIWTVMAVHYGREKWRASLKKNYQSLSQKARRLLNWQRN